MKPRARASALSAADDRPRLEVRRGPGRAACLLFGLAQISTVQAAGAGDRTVEQCPEAVFTAAEPDSPGAVAGALELLASLAQVCEGRDDFYARRGALLLTDGNYAEAAVDLEKALLLNPDRVGAQLDYAQALAGIGQRTMALDLIKQVAERPDIEPQLRAWLHQEVELWTQEGSGVAQRAASARPKGIRALLAREGRPVRWSTMVQASVGRETNLASTTHTRELNLFLVSGPVLVQLADNQRPQAGPAQRLGAALQAAIDLGRGAVRADAFVQVRSAPSLDLPTQQFTRVEASYLLPIAASQLRWAVARQDLQQGTSFAATDVSILGELRVGPAIGRCQGVGAFGLADQRYPLAENMAGHFGFVRAEARCSFGGDWHMTFTEGTDRPQDPERPGGTKRRHDLFLRYEHTFLPRRIDSHPLIGKPDRVSLWARRADSTDSRVYTELLGGDPTKTSRADEGFGLVWSLGRSWQLSFDVERNTQNSSNPLLNLRNLSGYLTLRWSTASQL